MPFLNPLAPENELLRLLARTEPSASDSSRVSELLRGPMDWDGFLRAASLHGVLPLIYQNLKNKAAAGVPSAVLSRFREFSLRNAGRNIRFAERLKRVCGLLEDKGIEAVPFKGPVLSQVVFGDVALRQFVDLDILVQKEAAWAAVTALGAEQYVPEISLSASQFQSFARRNKSMTMVSLSGGVPLDLHWDLGGDYAHAAMSYDSFKAGLETVEFLGASFSTLGGADLVLFLCLNGAMDSWSRLDHLCCVAELIQRHPDVLSAETYEKAKRLHLKRCLLAGCALVHSVLDVPIPDFLLGRIEPDGHVKAYVRACAGRLFCPPDWESETKKKPKFSRQHLLLKDGPADQLRHVFYVLFSPTAEDWRRMPLPGALGFLLYGYRPFRLASDFLRMRFGN